MSGQRPVGDIGGGGPVEASTGVGAEALAARWRPAWESGDLIEHGGGVGRCHGPGGAEAVPMLIGFDAALPSRWRWEPHAAVLVPATRSPGGAVGIGGKAFRQRLGDRRGVCGCRVLGRWRQVVDRHLAARCRLVSAGGSDVVLAAGRCLSVSFRRLGVQSAARRLSCPYPFWSRTPLPQHTPRPDTRRAWSPQLGRCGGPSGSRSLLQAAHARIAPGAARGGHLARWPVAVLERRSGGGGLALAAALPGACGL